MFIFQNTIDEGGLLSSDLNHQLVRRPRDFNKNVDKEILLFNDAMLKPMEVRHNHMNLECSYQNACLLIKNDSNNSHIVLYHKNCIQYATCQYKFLCKPVPQYQFFFQVASALLIFCTSIGKDVD